MNLSPKATKAFQRLETIASAVKLADGYWITDGDCAGEDYCGDCIDAAVTARIAEGFPDAIRDGGWSGEQDSPPYCEACGAKIDYTQTDHCTDEEIAHFNANPPDADISPEDAYDLVMAIDASGGGEVAERILLAWAGGTP